jgi:flagellar basal-body rod protein FlgG
VTLPGQVATSQVGQLLLATFANPAGLQAVGSNLFLTSGASGSPVTGAPNSSGFGEIRQGWTEASNVDSVTEISNLIIAQRAYEMNSKVITTADQMLQSTNTMKS